MTTVDDDARVHWGLWPRTQPISLRRPAINSSFNTQINSLLWCRKIFHCDWRGTPAKDL